MENNIKISKNVGKNIIICGNETPKSERTWKIGSDCNEVKWMEVKWCDVKCSEVKWSDLGWNVCIIIYLYKVVQIWPGLICTNVHTNQSRSYLNHLVHTHTHIYIYIYIYTVYISYQGNREVMNSNKEIYSVLKFTVVCQVTVLLFAVP